MRRFEYLIIVFNSSQGDLDERLNSLGELGWELIQTIPSKQYVWDNKYIFKREKIALLSEEIVTDEHIEHAIVLANAERP